MKGAEEEYWDYYTTEDIGENSREYEKRERKWDQRFLRLAREVSTWSKDPSTKVGCVIVDKEKRIVSVGCNGFAQKTNDTTERLNDRELKYKIVLHSEDNALLFADRNRLPGCTVYTYPFPPCSNCASKIIQAGADRVVALAPINNGLKERWGVKNSLAVELFEEAQVDFTIIEDIDNE